MLFDDVWPYLETHLFPHPTDERSFNPYNGHHPDLDGPNAQELRKANLKRYLSAYAEPPEAFLLAEAPGPWGCRFTGIPITSEDQLLDPDFPIDGDKTGAAETPYKELSATIHWRLLQPYFPRFFTWNSVPLHPHDPGEPTSIRTPRAAELKRWAPLVKVMIDAAQPSTLVAIGRKAEYVYKHLDLDCTYVRHPAHGGARKFEAGIRSIMGDPS